MINHRETEKINRLITSHLNGEINQADCIKWLEIQFNIDALDAIELIRDRKLGNNVLIRWPYFLR